MIWAPIVALAYAIVIGWATYRVGRLVILDDIFRRPIDRFIAELNKRSAVERWLSQLIGCPYCLTPWVSGVMVIVVDTATSNPVPLPWLTWGASAASALIVWERLDNEGLEVILKQQQPREIERPVE